MLRTIDDMLTMADYVCDYTPIISTVSNLVDLFQKVVIFPLTSMGLDIKKSHYYSHLNGKSISRCIILLIPFIGNFIIGMYDFTGVAGVAAEVFSLVTDVFVGYKK